MDLPADKAKLLKQYDNEKKWEIICDQVKKKQKQISTFNFFSIRICSVYLSVKPDASIRLFL